MSHTPVCRICAYSELTPCLHYTTSPRNIERLLEKQALAADSSVELRAVVCARCGHVQLPVTLADDYYDEYLMSHSHAPKMQRFQRQQAATFLEHFGLKEPRAFEAGCGDGQFSLILRELGCKVLANEPSAKARRACEEKGLDVVAGFVGRGAYPELAGGFDMVVARQVLEHVPDPCDFLTGLRELLKPGGVGLIEVPALEQALEHDRFFDFFPDHLSYFSADALIHACQRNRLRVERVQRAMDGEYNEVWMRRIESPSLVSIQAAADSIASTFQSFFAQETAKGRSVAVWGAGAKGVLTLALVDVSPVRYLVDMDPVKHTRFTPVSHLEVFPPDILKTRPVDTVLITALAYKDEIIRDLRENIGFQGHIACLSGASIIPC